MYRHVVDNTDDIARIVSQAASESATRLARERGLTLDSNSKQVIEKGLVDAVYASKSRYSEDPEVKMVIERHGTSESFRDYIRKATEEVISSILDYATTNRIEIQLEDVDHVIWELFSIWPFKKKNLLVLILMQRHLQLKELE